MKIGIKLLWYFHPDSFLTPFNENTKKIYFYIFYTSISFSHQTLASSATTTAGSYKMLETNGETWDGRSFTRASVGCNREDLWWGRPWYGREVSVWCTVDDDMLSSSPLATTYHTILPAAVTMQEWRSPYIYNRGNLQCMYFMIVEVVLSNCA